MIVSFVDEDDLIAHGLEGRPSVFACSICPDREDAAWYIVAGSYWTEVETEAEAVAILDELEGIRPSMLWKQRGWLEGAL